MMHHGCNKAADSLTVIVGLMNHMPDGVDNVAGYGDIDVAVIVPGSEITDPWEQWADIAGDVRKVSTLIEPVLMEDQEDSMLYREVMRTGVAV